MTDEVRNKLRDIDAERALIGSILLTLQAGQELTGEVLNILKGDYSLFRLGEVHELLLSMYAEGEPVDLLVLSSRLKKQAEKKTSTWYKTPPVEIDEALIIFTQCANTPMINEYAKIIIEDSNRRKAYDAGLRISKYAISPNGRDPLDYALREIEETSEGQRRGEFEYFSAAEIAALRDEGGLPKVLQLVQGIIHAEGVCLLAGDTSSGKTFLMLLAGIGVATGLEVWSRPVLKTGPVLFFGKDTSVSLLFNRVLDLCEGLSIPHPSDFRIAWCDADEDLDLSTPQGVITLRREIERAGAVLAIIDDLSTYAPGINLNDAAEVGSVMVSLRKISRLTGVAVLVATLLNKGNISTIGQLIYRIGGSIHIPGKSDTALVVTKTGYGDTVVRTINTVKNRIDKEDFACTFTIGDGERGGTVLAFERTAGAQTEETLVEITAAAMVVVLQEGAGTVWTRAQVEEATKARGLQAKGRTIKAAWKLIDLNKDIMVNKTGRPYTYTWCTDGS